MKTKEELLANFTELEMIIQKCDKIINEIESKKDFANNIINLVRFIVVINKKIIAIHAQVLAIYLVSYGDNKPKVI